MTPGLQRDGTPNRASHAGAATPAPQRAAQARQAPDAELPADQPPPRPDALCIGSVLWDIIGRTTRPLEQGADVPGRITRLPGGVALNIAMTLSRLGLSAAVLTVIGRDDEGDDLITAVARMGIDCTHVYRAQDLPTDRYLAIEGAGNLVAAIADAHSLEAAGERILAPLEDGRLGSATEPWPGLVALDGNLTADLLARIARSPLFRAADLRVAMAAPGKADRLRPLLPVPNATIYLNRGEAGILCNDHFSTAGEAAARLIALGARRVLVTDGARDCADGSREGILTATPPMVAVSRVTGAGDTFMAAHIIAERRGDSRAAALSAALDAAADYISGEPAP